MIVAADIEVDLAKFVGKPMYRTSTGLALKKTVQELDKAVAEAQLYQPQGSEQSSAQPEKKEKAGAYRHLLTGVSYMLPMVVAGADYRSVVRVWYHCVQRAGYAGGGADADWR